MSDEEYLNELPRPKTLEERDGPARTGRGKELSSYERERQRKALQKRNDQLYAESDSSKGPAFQAFPQTIEFRDFTLMQPEKKTIALTNVSSVLQTFKILPIEDEFRVTPG